MDLFLPLARLSVLVSFSAVAYSIGRLKPTSAVVVLVPTREEDSSGEGRGLLVCGRGTTAVLPGGPRGRTESWRNAAIRTLFQQTGVVTHPESLVLLDVQNDTEGRMHIICETPTITPSRTAPQRARSVFVARGPEDFAHALHRELTENWFLAKAQAAVLT